MNNSFTDELIIDSFAGGGGASTGIELALGRIVDIAINHNIKAIQMHEQNHPATKHYCENVFDVDPKEATAGRQVGLFWLSPDCTHFSKAKGGKPVKKEIRGLAWIAVKWAAAVKPRVIMLENVEEFMTWCPVKDGQPIKERKGETFNKFVAALKRLGYAVDWRILRACDYGAPTSRKRFFLIARCDGQPIIFPAPTHGKAAGLLPYRTAAEIIDWNIPCPSIFDRKKPLSENTLRRIARGIKKFIIDNPAPFIVQVNHTGGDFRGQDIKEPLQTVTAKNGYAVVTPIIANNNFENAGSSLNAPVNTITSQSNRNCLIAPSLIQVGYGENKEKNQPPRALDIQKPIGTIPAGGGKFAVCSAFISKHYGGNYTGAGSSLEEPLHTVTAQDHNAVITASFVSQRYGDKPDGGAARGSDLEKPLPTVTAKDHNEIITASFISRQFGTSTGHKMEEPLGTVTHFDKSRLVQAFLTKYFAEAGVSADSPAIITVAGVAYQIVDIGMRMLEPRELFNAHGFPLDYKIEFDVHGKKYSKAEQTARCGNSVCPPIVAALVKANLPELALKTALLTMAQLNEIIRRTGCGKLVSGGGGNE